MAIDSFIFGGNTGLTYEQLKRRRAVALALAAQRRGFPKTVGEGMTYLGESIGDMIAERRLDAAERGSAAYGAGLRREIEGGAAAAPAPVIPSAAPRPPAASRPVLPPAPVRPPLPRAASPASAAAPMPVLPSGPSSEAMTSGPPPSEFVMGGILNAAPMAAPNLEPVFPGEEGIPSQAAGILPSSGYLPPTATAAAPPSNLPAPTAAPTEPNYMDEAGWPAGPRRDLLSTETGAPAAPISPELQRAQEFQRSQGRPVTGPAAPITPARPAPGPQSSIQLTPEQRDVLARTVYGEASNQDDIGQQAVANVILNRARLAGTAPDYEALKKNQFEPWWNAKARARMERLSTEDPAYRRAQAAVDAALSGDDPTQGATHFYSPSVQAALGRRMPSWDTGGGEMIGTHKFLRLPYGGQQPAPADGGEGVTLAAYAPAGGVSDAPIPGMGGAGTPRLQPQIPPMQGPPPAPDEQVTPTDIEPMPSTAQFGPPAGRFSRTDAPVPGIGAPAAPMAVPQTPPAPAIAPRPSQEPIPPATPQTMADPGSAPQPPPPRPMHPTQQRILQALTDPRLDPNGPDAASLKDTFGRLEAERQRQEKIDLSNYTSQREGWEKRVLDREKFIREEADRNMKQQAERIGLQKSQAETQKIERELAGKETKEIGGVIYERTPAQPGQPASAWAISPGSPGKEGKITETEGKTLLALRRSTVAQSVLTNTGALAKLEDVAKGKAPFGAGNYLVSPEYQTVKSAADAWLLHTIRHESGAAIGLNEVPQFYPIYFPVPGDSEQQIATKNVRRREATRALYDSLGGGPAKDIADRFFEERKGRRATQSEGTVQVNPKTGKTRRVIGGHWEYDSDGD